MLELKKYGENINMMQERIGGGKPSDKPHKSSLFMKPKDPKAVMHRSADASQQNHYSFQNDKDGEVNNAHYPISNHVSFPSAVVEVNPSEGDGSSTLRSGSNNIADGSAPSSPGSPGGLQIDLDGSGSGQSHSERHSLNKGKLVSSGPSMLNPIKRNSQVVGSLDFNDVGPQTVSLTSPASSNLAKYKRGVKGRKAGVTLSALVSSLTERKRVAEMGVQGGVITPVTASGTPIGGASTHEGMETDQVADESEEAAPSNLTESPFSSIYHDRNKTAIALVDPDAKRVRKRKKLIADLPPKKSARTQATNGKPTTNGSDSAQNHVGEPMLVTTSDNQDIVTGNTTSVSFPASLNVDHPQAKTSSTPALTYSTSASTTHSSFTLGVPSHSTPRTGRGSTPSGTKKKGKSKGTSAHGRSPNKGARSTAAAAQLNANQASSTNASITASVAAINSTVAAQVSSHFTQALSKAHDSTGSLGGVRGEVAAPGLVEEDGSDFEGSGLLADTIRKVDKSFRARVNHMAGGTDDMGYQYFMEKVS